MTYPDLWVQAFALTLILEAPMYLLVLRRLAPWPRVLLAGAFATAVTHPLLWFVVP